jgi:hypothetical protein
MPRDLISYKIVGLDPLQIDESVSGSGKCSVNPNGRYII